VYVPSRLEHAQEERVWGQAGGGRLHMATQSVSLVTSKAGGLRRMWREGREIIALRTCTAVINAVIFGNTSTPHPPTPSVVMSHVMTPIYFSYIYIYMCVCMYMYIYTYIYKHLISFKIDAPKM